MAPTAATLERIRTPAAGPTARPPGTSNGELATHRRILYYDPEQIFEVRIMTSLQALASLAQILSGVAVVISLVYLANQVRQSTRAHQTENYARALDRLASMQALLSHDGELSRVFSRGVIDPSSLTPAQRTQLTWSLYEAFGAFEFMFYASKNDAIPSEVWERWSETTAWWLTFPGVRAWWNARPVPFTESFTAFVDSLIRENPTDAQAMKRWREFISS